MPRDVFSGTLLIAGSLLGVLVMILHPTAHGMLSPETAHRVARLGIMVHGVALAAVPMLFLGLIGVSRRLGPSDLTTAALVVWGFGGAAVMSAAVASGFVAPPIIQHILSEGESSDVYHALLGYTGLVNQGFAKVNVVASAVAVVLWSAAIFRSRRFAPATGVAGVVVGAGILLGFFSGHLRLDVHGFGIVTFVQSAWLIWLGILLCRDGGTGVEPAPTSP